MEKTFEQKEREVKEFSRTYKASKAFRTALEIIWAISERKYRELIEMVHDETFK
jgi:hypothetical protein